MIENQTHRRRRRAKPQRRRREEDLTLCVNSAFRSASAAVKGFGSIGLLIAMLQNFKV
jgi:hypothetical protein